VVLLIEPGADIMSYIKRKNMKSIYQHTQTGYLIIYIFFAILIKFAFLSTKVGLSPTLLATMIFVLLILSSFLTLKVTINDKYLKVKFGYGLFRKKFLLSEIASVKTVKNRWYYGWGIRIWFWPHMHIYNVSGFDAVEIKMRNDKRYRIGTNDPQNLEQAIKQVIK